MTLVLLKAVTLTVRKLEKKQIPDILRFFPRVKDDPPGLFPTSAQVSGRPSLRVNGTKLEIALKSFKYPDSIKSD